jgi:putative phage-type endonuclease
MSFYIIEDLEQGSSEWHAWRRGVVGASDASTIMGENRFKSRSYLIKEKLGMVKEFGGNAKTREGQNLEGVARTALEKKFNLNLKPIIVQDSQEPYLAASLDAICSNNNVVFEIKAGAKTYEHTLSSNDVPGYYVAQLQHILMVTQRDSMVFAAYRPNQSLITIDIRRNETYITKLRKLEKSFMNELSERGHAVQYQFVGRKVD